MISHMYTQMCQKIRTLILIKYNGKGLTRLYPKLCTLCPKNNSICPLLNPIIKLWKYVWLWYRERIPKNCKEFAIKKIMMKGYMSLSNFEFIVGCLKMELFIMWSLMTMCHASKDSMCLRDLPTKSKSILCYWKRRLPKFVEAIVRSQRVLLILWRWSTVEPSEDKT